MLERQAEQGNLENVKVFQKCACRGKSNGGFDWISTVEGEDFWHQVINYKYFELFFEEYPKSTSTKSITLNKRTKIKLNFRL